jgi:transposase
MQAYSLDLRERIVAAVDAGQPHSAVAQRFGVSPATIRNYLRLRRETGGLAPRPRPGGQPEIGPDRYPLLLAQLRADPDATLEQHCATWAAAHGRLVSVSTMWRAIERTGWTDKQRRWARPSATR